MVNLLNADFVEKNEILDLELNTLIQKGFIEVFSEKGVENYKNKVNSDLKKRFDPESHLEKSKENLLELRSIDVMDSDTSVINKAFFRLTEKGQEFFKGKYVSNPQNRKLGRVGQQYGGEKEIFTTPRIVPKENVDENKEIGGIDTISMEEWKKIPKDYKSVIDGQRHRLKMVSGGTTLAPVNVESKKSPITEPKKEGKPKISIPEQEKAAYEFGRKSAKSGISGTPETDVNLMNMIENNKGSESKSVLDKWAGGWMDEMGIKRPGTESKKEMKVSPDPNRDWEIAKTIQQQIGGKALYMLGAKSLYPVNNGLFFKIGRNSESVSGIRITLTSADTYDVEYLSKMGNVKSEEKGLYAEMLNRSIEYNTGMNTSL